MNNPNQPTTVPLFVRYQSAWAELNERLQARQNVNLVYATVSWAVLASAASGQGSNAFAIWLGLLLPILSLAFALWLCHQDLTIGLLSKFCSACERWGDEANYSKIPSWHSPTQGVMSRALKYRIFSDCGFLFIMIITNIPSLFLGRNVLKDNALHGIVLLIIGMIGIGAVFLVAFNTWRRSQILNGYDFVRDSELNLKFKDMNKE